MMDGNTICVVKNRSSSKVAYVIPEEGIRREFMPGETKNIKFAELEKLSWQAGGNALMTHFLQVKMPAAAEELGIHTEIEYNYTEDEIKNIILNGSVDQFKDTLDFAPIGVKDLIKKFAVELPMESTPKIEYLKEKTGFDLQKALANKKAEAADENAAGTSAPAATGRRVAVEAPVVEEPAAPARRYKVTNREE